MDEPEGKEWSTAKLTIVGDFLLDRETIRVWRGDKPLQVSMRQFQLLDFFMRHAGQPLSLKALKEHVWGPGSTIREINVTTEIVKLRRAIGGRKREQPIRTVRKLGYVFEVPKRKSRVSMPRSDHEPSRSI
jgi:DNA-binding response OmpR family regulator